MPQVTRPNQQLQSGSLLCCTATAAAADVFVAATAAAVAAAGLLLLFALHVSHGGKRIRSVCVENK